ncbi:PQQ-binding-like beta-propeller repeat protein [Pseudomaricurvus sp. HS19]|uniref:outer membrane protein assembly factor BamB family protein n=1 Tax=Pseudomaricurvus sp. HS19 TaxID=2692626 RepID=UPI00136A6810|nr:PQQ-binding-like beta-propeller repeat protein [Pseudomaricurvus sp. HS19]MYM64064.1 PQQ-binding-like beta-propeller repeat protein [Pseudomaricurvus sp. HS19]
MKKLPLLALSALLTLTGCQQEAPDTAVSADKPTPAAPESQIVVPDTDWPNYGGDGREQHYSELDQVSLANIGQLDLAWYYDLEPGFSVSSPVTGGNKLFTTTGNSFIRAFDAASGELLWEFDAKTRDIAQSPLHMSWGNKGIAWWNNRVFLATTDGRVIALDDSSGQPLWEQRQFELNELRNSNGAPRVFDGKVIIGHGGADISPIRGYVTAYDAMTGEQLWRFYTTPGNPAEPPANKAEEVMQPTWKGDWYGKGGGGTAWNAFSYDQELDLIYLGVGNGFPYNHQMRSPGGGDNLFLASIVAVKADTGEYVWHYQVCPAEQWDCTAVQDMTIGNITLDGQPRKVIMHAPKNGFFYVLDAASGEFISAEKIAKVTWAEKIDPDSGRPVENPGIRYQNNTELFELWPGPQGAHSWLPQAFSQSTGLVYVPIIEMGALIGPPNPNMPAISAGMGVTMIPDAELPDSRRSFLRAWNPATQTEAWSLELPGDWPGGVLATGGDLVFQGRMDGYLVAYNARTGAEVWSYKTVAPVVAAPIAYSVAGKQYISVLTGSGSQGGGIMATGNAAFRTDYALPRRLLTFALDGTARRPEFVMPAQVPLQDPDFVPQKDRVMSGAMAFAGNACLVCHGMNAIGGGAAPDLRFSPMILDAAAFKTVVKDGVLKPRGMPPTPWIDDAALEDIRHYLRLRAMQAPAELQALKTGKSTPASDDAAPVISTGT